MPAFYRMSSKMIIRPAKLSDASRLAELASQLGYPSTSERTGRLLRALIPGDVVLLAEEDEVVGGVQIGLRRTYTSEPTAELISMVVDERHRGKGIGRKLLAAADAWALEQGMSRMVLRTNVIRADAHAFYEHLGYKRLKEQRVYLKELAAIDD